MKNGLEKFIAFAFALLLGVATWFVLKKKRLTLGTFLAKLITALFAGYMLHGYMEYRPYLQPWYGQIIALSSLLSSELISLAIKMFKTYADGLKNKNDDTI